MWNGIDVGGRSVIIRLRDGSLWVHSPVALDDSLRGALASLGPVRHVVAPNFEHVKYAAQWLSAYPEARGYGCPELRAAMPQLGLHADARDERTGAPPPEWGDSEFELVWLDAERNPFTGKPFFNELLFLHRGSRTAMVTDFWWNYPSGLPLGSRAWKFGMDVVYGPFYDAFMVKDRAAHARCARQVASWDIHTLVPCHGGVLRGAAARDALLAQFGAAGELA